MTLRVAIGPPAIYLRWSIIPTPQLQQLSKSKTKSSINLETQSTLLSPLTFLPLFFILQDVQEVCIHLYKLLWTF
jgi:hypothetical protein